MTSQPAGGTPAGRPGHGRAREPGPGTPGPRPPRHQADTHRRNLGRRRAVRRRPAADLHPGNSQSVSIGYFGAHGLLPLGAALLLTAILGVLLAVSPGAARIIQLRTTARRHRRLDTERPASPAVTPPSGHDHPAPADPASPAGA